MVFTTFYFIKKRRRKMEVKLPGWNSWNMISSEKVIFSQLLAQISLSSFNLLKKCLNQSCRSLWDLQLWCFQLFISSRNEGEKSNGSRLCENRIWRFYEGIVVGSPCFCPLAPNDWICFDWLGTEYHVDMFDQLGF